MLLYLVGHLAAFVGVHIGHMLSEVADGGMDGLDRLLHTVADVQDDGILHAVCLTGLIVGQPEVFIALAEHIRQMSDISNMLTDALLHLAEHILYVANLVGTVAYLHRLIQLPIGHAVGSVYELLQRLQLVMADEEAEKSEQHEADETDDDRQAQESVV